MRALFQRVRDRRADKYLGTMRVVAQAGFRVLLGVMVARFAGPEAFAVYVQLVTLEVVATTIWNARFVQPLGSLGPGLPLAERGHFVRFALEANRRRAVHGVVLAALATPLARELGVVPLVWLGFCASMLAWLEANARLGALVACFKSGRALCSVVLGFGLPTLCVPLAQRFELPVLAAFFWSSAIGHGLACLWMGRSLPAGQSAAVLERTQRGFRRFGRIAVFGSVANSACTRVQPFVLGALAGPVAVALFGAAQTLSGPVRVLGGALGEVLRPRLALFVGAEGEPWRVRRALGLSLIVVGLSGSGLIVVSWLAGERIALAVFGPDYPGLGAVLPMAATFVLLATVGHLLVVAMQTLDENGPQFATRWRTVAAVLSLALVAPACAWDGARGAFLGMAAAELLFLMVSIAWLRGRLPGPRQEERLEAQAVNP